MKTDTDSLTFDGVARWVFHPGLEVTTDRSARNVQIFRWLEAIQAESLSGATEVDAEVATELRRLDAKLSMVLDLLLDRSSLAPDRSGGSDVYAYTLSAVGVQLEADSVDCLIPAGSKIVSGVGILEWYPEPRWPSPLRFRVQPEVSASTVQCQFLQMSEPERDCLERWIFREHRRARERYR